MCTVILILLGACGSNDVPVISDPESANENIATETEAASFGEQIDPDGAITPAELLTQFEGRTESDGYRMQAKLKTTINTCCKKKGCWMDVQLGNGEEMKVTFKDYGFFVPLDSDGKEVIMQGLAYLDTVSVEMLQHYAEDAGKTEEEIAAITDPEYKLTFEATGVLIN